MFPKYIVATAADSGAEFVGRGRGPLLHPIGNGILLAICLGGTMFWWPRLNRVGQLALLAAFAAAGGGHLLHVDPQRVDRRRADFGFGRRAGAAVELAAAAGGRRRWLSGSSASTHWDQLVTFKRDKALEADKTAESVELRPIMAVVAWHMFLDRPLLGCGYAQYRTEHLNYLSDRSTDLPLERARDYIPHNVVFSLLTETGLVGLGLFAAMLIGWARDAWRLWGNTNVPLWARQQGLLLLVTLGAI